MQRRGGWCAGCWGVRYRGKPRRGERGFGLRPVWRVIKEIKAAAKAEWIFFRFIKGLALGFLPEDVGVERDLRARGGRGWVAEKRVGFHLVELSVGEARSAVREGKSTMAPLVNGHRNAV